MDQHFHENYIKFRFGTKIGRTSHAIKESDGMLRFTAVNECNIPTIIMTA